MKTRILLCMMALWAICAAAQPSRHSMCALNQKPLHSLSNTNLGQSIINLNQGFDLVQSNDVIETYNDGRKVESHDDGPTVTCKFVYDESKYERPIFVYAFRSDGDGRLYLYDAQWYIDNKTMVCPLQAGEGTYDFCVMTTDKGPFGAAAGCYIIKEEVDITSDTTLVFNLSDSDKKYSMTSYRPNGEEFKVKLYEISEDLMTVELIEEGNVYMMGDQVLLCYKNNRMIPGFASSYEAKTNFLDFGCFYMNDVSDNYEIVYSRAIDADSMYYVCQETTKPSKQEYVLKNNPDDFVLFEETFVPSLINNPDAGDGVIDIRNQLLFEKPDAHAQAFGEFGPVGPHTGTYDGVQGNKVSIYVDASRSQEVVKPLVAPMYGDKVKWQHDGIVEYAYIVPPFAIVSKDEITYYYAGCDEEFMHSIGGQYKELYPGSPHFSYTDKEKGMLFGASCPISVFMTESLENADGTTFVYLSNHWVGRLGEIRESDMLAMKTNMKHNGQSICRDYNQIPNAFVNAVNSVDEGPVGDFDIAFQNENMMVDGLQGSNKTRIHFNVPEEWWNEDWAAPTLQMLWFKNTEGVITDRFDVAQDGILEFAAGDFKFVQDERFYWNECLDHTVEVLYSPYRYEDWKPLDVTEIPENFYMPSFGSFYTAPLADVTEESWNGWYDLLVKVTDSAGNYQQQMISPAFRIDHAQSSVATLRDNNAREVARYNMAGQRVDANATGVVVVRMSDGTARKVVL